MLIGCCHYQKLENLSSISTIPSSCISWKSSTKKKIRYHLFGYPGYHWYRKGRISVSFLHFISFQNCELVPPQVINDEFMDFNIWCVFTLHFLFFLMLKLPHSLASGSHFKLAPEFFWYDPRSLQESLIHFCFLMQWYSRLILYISCPRTGISHFSKSPGCF